MMKNIISSPYRKMKLLLILPVFAIVFYAFAKPDYTYKYVDERSGNNGQVFSSQTKTVKGIVKQQNGEALPGAIIVIQGTTIGTITDAQGHFTIENVPDDGQLVISFVGFKSKVLKPVFTTEMKINMVRDTVKFLNENISTPPPPPPPPLPSSDNAYGRTPLYVVDGITVPRTEAEKIDPDSIESVYVLKDKSATEKQATDKYGEKGKDDVVEIITKGKSAKMLVIIDGVLHEKDGMSAIHLDDIKTMSVLTEKLAIEKYGEKGKNGAIEVTLYKSEDEKPDIKVVAIHPGDPKTGIEPVEVVQSVPKPDKNALVVLEEMPEFPGGTDAMVAWITSNLKYPAEAVKAKIIGKVYVNFVVSSTGKVKNVVVSKSASPMLNAEAIRVISSMPVWKPGSQGGKAVNVQMLVPVEFKLK